jgi:putative phage-type endonuclease
MTLDLDFRRGKVPASLLPAIVGVNPWSGPLDAWLRITGRHQGEQTEGQAWGHYVERSLLSWYADRERCELAHFGSLAHAAHPWLIATPDASRFGSRVVVEAKNVGARVAHHWTDESPPDYVYVQAQTQLEVCDADRCDVIATIGGAAPAIYRLERDREVGALLVEAARAFYFDHVEADDAPAFDGRTTAQALQTLFPRHHADVPLVKADADLAAVMRRYAAARAARDEATAALEVEKARICAAIGDGYGAESTEYRATWFHREAVEVKAHVRPAGRHFDLRELKTKKGGKAA